MNFFKLEGLVLPQRPLLPASSKDSNRGLTTALIVRINAWRKTISSILQIEKLILETLFHRDLTISTKVKAVVVSARPFWGSRSSCFLWHDRSYSNFLIQCLFQSIPRTFPQCLVDLSLCVCVCVWCVYAWVCASVEWSKTYRFLFPLWYIICEHMEQAHSII